MAKNSLEKMQRLAHASKIMCGIVALEGWTPDAEIQDIQRRLIEGELSFDQAVKIVIDSACQNANGKKPIPV